MQVSYPHSIKQAIIVFLILLGVTIGISLVFTPILTALGYGPKEAANSFVLKVFGYAIPFGFTIWLVLKKLGRPDNLQWGGWPPAGIILYGLASVILLGLLAGELMTLLPGFEEMADFLMQFLKPDLGTFIAAVLLAPVLEEILFRGVILSGLLNRYRAGTAIGLSALLFGLAHLNPLQFLGGLLLGVLFGWIYYHTRSLLLVIALHAVNNLISFAASLWLGKDVYSVRELVNSRSTYTMLLIGATMLLAIGVFRLHIFFQKIKSQF